MKEINNDAEKEKRAKKKDKAGLKEMSRDVQNLEKGAMTEALVAEKALIIKYSAKAAKIPSKESIINKFILIMLSK